MKPGAQYLSVSLSEKDQKFGGVGKCRESKHGFNLYFSSESEIRDLFSPYFVVKELKTIEVEDKVESHYAIYALSERR
jgi:hypothetical protein